MSIEFGWDNDEHTTILAVFDERWTWDEFRAREPEVKALITTVDHPVDFIMWFKTPLPPGAFVTEFYAMQQKIPANLGRTVVIEKTGALVKVAMSVVQNATHAPNKIIFVKTLEEARAALAQT